MSNKDLDLPSVKEMLATVRCNEIATQAVKDAKKEFESSHAKLQRGTVLDDLGDRVCVHRAKALGALFWGEQCRLVLHIVLLRSFLPL